MELLKEILAGAEGLTEEIIRLRRELHQHPELSHQEQRTAGVVARYLQDLGLEVRTGIADHGVVATLEGSRPGKTVAWRADMDALPLEEKVHAAWCSRAPGVMHACGHDFHMSIGLAAARLLSGMKDRLAGRFRFIFQPAEEGPPRGKESGAPGMVAAGVLNDPPVDAICALHVAPNLEVGLIRHSPEVVMAGADRVELAVTGKAAHGATPHRGVDPILVSAQALQQIQGYLAQRVDARHPIILTFGRINGGNRFNILAERVDLEGSFRYLQESVRQEVQQGLKMLLAGLAQGSGAKIELNFPPTYPILRNDPQLSRRAVEILGRVLGKKHLKAHQPAMGSEDFAYYAARVPAFYFFLGVRSPGGKRQALHSPEFNPDEGGLVWGLKAAAGLMVGLGEP